MSSSPERERHERTLDELTENVEHLTFTQAAERLNVSADAVRMRVRRGSLATIRTGNETFVLWPQPERTNTRRTQDRTRSERRIAVPRDDRLIARLESENAFLRSELDARTEEIRRKDQLLSNRDQLLRDALERIPPSLPAGETYESAAQDAIVAPLRGDQPIQAAESLIDRLRRFLGR